MWVQVFIQPGRVDSIENAALGTWLVCSTSTQRLSARMVPAAAFSLSAVYICIALCVMSSSSSCTLERVLFSIGLIIWTNWLKAIVGCGGHQRRAKELNGVTCSDRWTDKAIQSMLLYAVNRNRVEKETGYTKSESAKKIIHRDECCNKLARFRECKISMAWSNSFEFRRPFCWLKLTGKLMWWTFTIVGKFYTLVILKKDFSMKILTLCITIHITWSYSHISCSMYSHSHTSYKRNTSTLRLKSTAY
jgi:hypothetical protein